MSAGTGKTILAGAALRALRHWLFELGHENATIASGPEGLSDVYHLLDVGRLVQVRTAIAPCYPEGLSRGEIRVLRRIARRLGANAWEAQIIVRPNFQASAILWRNA